jgi:hypothetical protein
MLRSIPCRISITEHRFGLGSGKAIGGKPVNPLKDQSVYIVFRLGNGQWYSI